MIRSRFGLLSLCAVVFGVLAFSATAAQAEVGAQWLFAKLINATEVELIKPLPAFVQLEKDTKPVLHTKIAGITVLYECENLEATNAKLLANGSIGEKEGTVKNSRIKFTGCITLLNGAKSAPCEPKFEGTTGVILTKPGHGLIVLHKLADGTKDELVQVLPDEGEILATFESGAECAIGAKVNILGKLFLQDCVEKGKGLLKHVLKHLFEVSTILTELFVISKTEEHKATILGSWWGFLIGEHKGLHWGGDPA